MISSVDRRSEYVENRAGANVRLNNFLTPYTLDDKSSILNAPCGYSNGVYASLRPVQTFGPELVTNGDFATDSDWTKGTNWSIANGKATVTNSTTSSIFQDILNVSKKYKVTFEITEITSGSLRIGIGQNFSDYFTQVGTYTYYGKIFLDTLLRINPSSGTNASIDNVSVKEVTDADFDFTRGSAATRVTKDGLIKNVQILSGELVKNGDFEEIGSELVINGDFATDSDWSGSISISGGQATKTNSGLAYQSGVITAGKQYKIVVDIATLDGTTNIYTGGNSSGALSVGVQTIYMTGGSSNDFLGLNNGYSTGVGTVFNSISVKEVGQNWEFNSTAIFTDNGINITTGGYIRQDVVTSGKKYKLTYDIVSYTSGSIRVYDGTDQGNIPTNLGSNTFNFTAGGSVFYIQSNSVNVNLTITNISVIEITDATNLPRIDYTNGTGSLLLEPQSTNLITYSEDFSQWDTTQNATLTSDSTTSPDGLVNATKITDNSTIGNHRIFTSLTTTSGSHTFSVYLKKGTMTTAFLRFVSGSDIATANVNLEEGTITPTTGSAKIEDVGNDWYRCSITGTASSGTSYVYVYMKQLAGYSGTSQNLYLWGAQVEALSYATSYIPNLNGEVNGVTRLADLCNNAGSSDLINSTEGVLYAEISSFKNGGIGDRTISISDGSTQNAIQLLLHNTANRINFRLRSGGSLDVNISDFTFEQNQINKIACKYKSGDYALWVNGEERATSTSSSLPSGLSVLAFDDGSLNDFYGNVRSVAVFKEALTDEELAKITSTTQQEAFYEMRDKMLQINADYYEFGDYTTRLKKLF